MNGLVIQLEELAIYTGNIVSIKQYKVIFNNFKVIQFVRLFGQPMLNSFFENNN